MEFKHKSVLLDESIEALHIKPNGIYVDGTLGGGGHVPVYGYCCRVLCDAVVGTLTQQLCQNLCKTLACIHIAKAALRAHQADF